MNIYDTIEANTLTPEAVIAKADPMAAARAAKAAKKAAQPSEGDRIAQLEADLAAARAQIPTAPEAKTLNFIPGKKLTETALQKAREAADMIPTTAEELRQQEQALYRLKQASPSANIRIVRTRRGKFVRPKFIRPGVYEPETHYTNPTHVMISGDDLADITPGGLGKKFAVGDTARVTPQAAERLIAQGLAEPA